MTIRARCVKCEKQLTVADGLAGSTVLCPDCGTPFAIGAARARAGDGRRRRRAQADLETVRDAGPSTSVGRVGAASVGKSAQPIESDPHASDTGEWRPAQVTAIGRGSRRRRITYALLAIVPILLVTALVVVPSLIPKDPREIVLRNYIAAIQSGDRDAVNRFGVLPDPPPLASIGRALHVEEGDYVTEGSFAKVANFHARIGEEYETQGRVYLKKDKTGVLADVINLREEILENPEELFPARPKPGQDDLDRAVEFAENQAAVIQKLGDVLMGGPKKRSLTVTYDQVLKETGIQFDQAQSELVEDFRANPERWRRLLDRDVRSIREEGDFKVLQSTWDAEAWLPTQSPGEDPKRVRFTLVRFQLGLIDSGWKVWEIESAD